MKEVTPDPDVLKGSVFHRLIQRAFPDWFPYDSIRFFHPFYTGDKNLTLAKQQGYQKQFKDKTDSGPKKPSKPIVVSAYDKVKEILAKGPNSFVNTVFLNQDVLPPKIRDIVQPGYLTTINQAISQSMSTAGSSSSLSEDDESMLLRYFAVVTREMVLRAVITIPAPYGDDKPERDYILQFDTIRDMAIPVTARYVADFLGFSHLLKSVSNPRGKFSENEIYQHITNCQVFIAHNIDETKMWKRRTAFKASMKFLYDLAANGTIKEANSWRW